MPNVDGSGVTWKQIGAIISIIALVITCGGVMNTKADKSALKDCEKHMGDRVDLIQRELKEDIRDVKDEQLRQSKKMDKIYDILIDIRRNGSDPNH